VRWSPARGFAPPATPVTAAIRRAPQLGIRAAALAGRGHRVQWIVSSAIYRRRCSSRGHLGRRGPGDRGGARRSACRADGLGTHEDHMHVPPLFAIRPSEARGRRSGTVRWWKKD